nr:sporulation histidine kinase inhibitor Sda [Paenibacillus sp. SYP-B4298]
MEILSDELLVDSYNLALQLNLDPEFIGLLFAEIRKREIEPTNHRLGA